MNQHAKRHIKAQGILEYVVVLCVIIAALLVMGYYLRNSLSGKFREGADTVGQGEIYIPFGGTEVSGYIMTL